MPRPPGHPDNVTIAQLAASERWANEPDRKAATEPARAAFRDRFLNLAREKFGDLDPDELAYRAEKLQAAHFKRMALRSAQARRKRAAASVPTGGEAA